MKSIPVFDLTYDVSGTFIKRDNRFLATVDIGKRGRVKVHVRDPGRLEEILYRGNQVLLSEANNPNRKTEWDLIAGRVENMWILINSGFHRRIARWILNNSDVNPFTIDEGWQAEKKLGESRIDFLNENDGKKFWVEVKGCTLAKNNIALFPDAPTTRGTKHLNELTDAVKKGDKAGLMILVFRSDAKCFLPHTRRDPAFTDAFWEAVDAGVKVYPLRFRYDSRTLYYEREIPICY